MKVNLKIGSFECCAETDVTARDLNTEESVNAAIFIRLCNELHQLASKAIESGAVKPKDDTVDEKETLWEMTLPNGVVMTYRHLDDAKEEMERYRKEAGPVGKFSIVRVDKTVRRKVVVTDDVE